jgi:hypothetical protein
VCGSLYPFINRDQCPSNHDLPTTLTKRQLHTPSLPRHPPAADPWSPASAEPTDPHRLPPVHASDAPVLQPLYPIRPSISPHLPSPHSRTRPLIHLHQPMRRERRCILRTALRMRLQERYACPNNTSSSLLSAAPRAASSDGSSSRATHTLISSSLTNCPWQNSSAFACILRR